MCDDCHVLTQKSMGFNDVVFPIVRGNNYRIHFIFRAKKKAVDRPKHAVLIEKSSQP